MRPSQAIGISVIALMLVGCRHANERPSYVVTYYDRNHDGVVDLEFHHCPGWTDADWGFIDSDYNGCYDILFGPGFHPPTKVLVPVPGGVPITKKLPKELRFP